MTDQQALERYARHGDVDAFQHLVDTYQRLVYAACRRQLQREADVEDAVQETFLRLAKHAGTIRRNAGAWLHTCATHVAVTRIRRDATRRRHELAWTPVADPDAAQASHDIMAQVDAALEQLSAADRELILSHYLKGQTQTTLAEQQGISQPGLKYRLDRAVERLRTQLKKRGVATSATAVSAFLVTDAAHAQVPAALTAGLTKLGLSGAGVAVVGTTTGTSTLATLAGSKLAWASVAALTLTAGGVTIAVQQRNPNPPPANAAALATTPLANNPDDAPRDPAFSRPLHPTGFHIDGKPNFAARFENQQLVIQEGGVTRTHEVTACDPDASPATLDVKLIRVDGNTDAELQEEIGKTVRMLYRVEAGGTRLVISHRAPGQKRPRRFPRNLPEAMEDRLEVGVLVRPAPANPNQAAEGPIDPALLGPWTLAEPLFYRVTRDVIYIHDILNPDGEPLGDITIREWKLDAKPRRLAGIVRSFPDPGRLGVAERWIYQVRPDGKSLRMASFEEGTAHAATYPTGFNDHRPGLVTVIALPYEK